MSKKTTLSVAVSLSEQSEINVSGRDKNIYSTEEEHLHTFHSYMFQLREEVNHLSFMMSEIRSVLESPSSKRRFLA